MSKKRNRLALPVGYRLGRYRLGDQLGAGTFGITYLAQDLELNREVAIKELLPRDIVSRAEDGEVVAIQEAEDDQWEWAKERFMQEASTIAACTHPNILQVYQTFRASGTVYMVTRYEDGCVLKEWLEELGRPPDETELRRILMPMLSALERVHSRGFLHRDIQPQNVYLTCENGPVLIDFGSARQVVNRRSQPVTSIVCEGYAPFEQYSDTGQQGPWTDLYGLAAVLYRCVVGKKPPNAPDRALSQGNDPCLRLASSHAGKYSREFLQAIDKAMAIEARLRFQTAGEWRAALGPPVEIRDEIPPPPPTTRYESTERSAPERSVRVPPPPVAAGVASKGADVVHDLVITAQEAATGVDKMVGFERMTVCSSCAGTGQVRSRGPTSVCPACRGSCQTSRRCQMRVRLPAGTRHGASLTSAGQGHAGNLGGASGDLHVRVQIEGSAPAPWESGRPASRSEGSVGSALVSLLMPGIGNVPHVAVLPSMFYLLSTAGAYFVAFYLWDSDPAYPVAAVALLLHLGSVVAAWRMGTVELPTRLLPWTVSGWLATTFLFLLLCGTGLMVVNVDDISSWKAPWSGNG